MLKKMPIFNCCFYIIYTYQ